MNRHVTKIIRRILWLDGGLLFFFIIVLASPSLAQSIADVLNSSGLAATRAAEIASSTDGVLKLALWAVILLVMLLGATVAYLMKIMTQIACSLDRLSSRPCLISQEGLEDYMRRKPGHNLIPR